MSITQITREFLGLSSDTKPTNVTTGSKFIELDTKKVFIFDGSSWYLNPMPVMVTDSLPTGSNIIGKVGIDSGNNGVSIIGSLANDVTFHNAAIVAADGTILTVGGYKTLTVEIYGTSTSRTIAFIGRGPSGTDRAIMGVRLSDLSTGSSTTGTGEIWQFDITGLSSVFVDLQAVAGGNVTAKGRVVA
ncbi:MULTISPECIES: hypothetical protein [Dehalobacter]|uniref:Uncharacterized protein n=1 Tax=Dehalobacter restrictus (strain DSM 9455 / PER-K23) TaxID=871738 RepID=A0ABM5P6P9_DEHRP|nr:MULTISPECIES: hypothetical protein [Dehalobacter]AHF10362.1 hypothetical protein DEHRE_09960 [Dehalobacter restrictus DSM 9455]MDJ0304930.1 hypothetical protein [Dehalobacter sp.]